MILLVLCSATASAQLSPGKLAQPHAHLEGLTRCGKCHTLGSKELQTKCLECHVEIKAMRDEQRGLHSRNEYDRCVTCHVDHHGRDFKMIHWPDGQDRFDHALTGHDLVGAHSKLKCRQCHRPDLIPQAARDEFQAKDLQRTFLGLEPGCTSCHVDAHGQQFAGLCIDCHDQDSWSPASRFDHGNTAFPLTGSHRTTPCEKCHRPAEDASTYRSAGGSMKSVVPYRGLAHAACMDCHVDPHQTTLGTDCIRCHDTTGWQNIRGEGFDHGLTRYPLEGKHAAVTCQGCHSGERKTPAYDRCDRCHQDAHGARSLNRPRLLECEACHSVQGYKPVRYSLSRHQETGFPLVGAHRAVPCQVCHQDLAGDRQWTMRLPFETCTSCHDDPHKGLMNASDQDRGCIACHTEDSWKEATFDHSRTGFLLEGRHARVVCVDCHGTEGFKTDRTQCAQCHEDPHHGQFQGRVLPDGTTIDCAGCHVVTDWLAERFDHETDSRFPLRGGHRGVACKTCHQPQDPTDPRLLIYKPLAIECISCHVDNPDIKRGKE